MATIKKAFVEIHELLTANTDRKVSSIMDELTALMSAKTGSGGGGKANFHRNEAGEVVAVQCYYFKRWFLVDQMPFGAKASSASGLSSMSKEGTSNWTKQQAEAKKAKAQLLTDVAEGKVAAEAVPAELAKIEAAREEIKAPETNPGFETLEEALASIA